MLTLTGPGTAGEQLVWLPEPATATLCELQTRTVALIEEMCSVLEGVLLGDRAGWLLPEGAWRLDRESRRSRIVHAQAFKGFDPDSPVPPVSEIRVHERSVPRLQLAERLRVRSYGAS